MPAAPIVMISSYAPRLCGIATFCEEAREFIQRANPHRDVLVISHTDGEGDGVFPLFDNHAPAWWKPVVEKVKELDPYAIHIQHEYGLYEHVDERGRGDHNAGFLEMLDGLAEYPVIVEPHTVHGRLTDHEAEFVYQVLTQNIGFVRSGDYYFWDPLTAAIAVLENRIDEISTNSVFITCCMPEHSKLISICITA